jgi:hypothetical protein
MDVHLWHARLGAERADWGSPPHPTILHHEMEERASADDRGDTKYDNTKVLVVAIFLVAQIVATDVAFNRRNICVQFRH